MKVLSYEYFVFLYSDFYIYVPSRSHWKIIMPFWRFKVCDTIPEKYGKVIE